MGVPLSHPGVRQAVTLRPRTPCRDRSVAHPRPVQRQSRTLNQKIRVLARIAFGFHTPDALIALAMLALGGLCPSLPGSAQPAPR